MKKENEEKARFFAQYIFQKVWHDVNWGTDPNDSLILEPVYCESPGDWEILLLKPLSSISDEDALFAYRDHYPLEDWDDKDERDRYDTPYAVDWLRRNLGKPNYIKLTSKGADYLRSQGYALPYNGYTVEQMIQFGWIKLKEI